MKRNIQILMALVFISTFSMEAEAKQCKTKRIGVYVEDLFLSVAEWNAVNLWDIKAATKYGFGYGWRIANSKRKRCKIRIRNARTFKKVWRCTYSAIPCRKLN